MIPNAESVEVETLRVSTRKAKFARTHAAQVVTPYTKARGKYVTVEQHALSHFLAQVFRFIG